MASFDVLDRRAKALGFACVKVSQMTPDSSIQRFSVMLEDDFFEVWVGWSPEHLEAFLDGYEMATSGELNSLKQAMTVFYETLASDEKVTDRVISAISPQRVILPPVGKGK